MEPYGQSFIVSNDGSENWTPHTIQENYEPFVWKNALYAVDFHAVIYRLKKKSKYLRQKFLKNEFSEPEFIRQLQKSLFLGARKTIGKFFVDGEKIIHYNEDDDFRTS